MHPDCPADKVGKFRLDGDGAHWIGPFDPDHSPDPEQDFPPEAVSRPSGSPYPGMALWSPHGIIQDGLHGGPPLYHFSCLYELQPIAEGEGGFGCIAGSHQPDALIGPHKTSPLGAGHVPWGKPPWPPHIEREITQVRWQPGDCGASHDFARSRHTLIAWHGSRPSCCEIVRQHLGHHYQWLAFVGTAVFFTERLVHSTLPWKGKGERRSLFVKYAPYGMHYADRGYDLTLPELSDFQREILAFPDKFLHDARHRSSRWYNAERQHGDYDMLPALYSTPKL